MKGVVPSLWQYWEVEEPLGGGLEGRNQVSAGVPLKWLLGFWGPFPSLCCSVNHQVSCPLYHALLPSACVLKGQI